MPTAPLDEHRVWEALRTVNDPEVGMNVVELVWDPPWTPALMSLQAKQSLGWEE